MKIKSLLIALTLMAGLSSCAGGRVVYIGTGTTKMVQLRETVKGVKVWVMDDKGVKQPAASDLPEGGFYRSDLNLQ
jgi:hypothetical protein